MAVRVCVCQGGGAPLGIGLLQMVGDTCLVSCLLLVLWCPWQRPVLKLLLLLPLGCVLLRCGS